MLLLPVAAVLWVLRSCCCDNPLSLICAHVLSTPAPVLAPLTLAVCPAGGECKDVFDSLVNQIVEHIKSLRAERKKDKDTDPVYVYLASDNSEVKNAFLSLLANHTDISRYALVMRVDAQAIYHVKNLAHFKSITNNEGLLDLVFDWYALSLANTIFAWRKGGSNMLSTFVHSAQKLSGTIERTDIGANKGIGAKGYQLIRDKRNRLRFEMFWSYPFLEDYATPPKRDERRLARGFV